MRVRLVALSFFICTLAWGATPSVSHAAASVVITQSTTFSPGEYFFDSLTITSTSTLTLLGNPTATTSFKGVIIHAENLIVDSGSRISADSKGYGANQGPGASSLSGAGASYGGVGASNTATSAPTYGSAMEPVELGSGGNSPGGGAMQLLVSGSFINDGTISANGGSSGSGGSILVTAGTLSGKGSFKALGGNLWASGYYKQPGGGGRIMIRYAASSFTGTLDVSGGCGGPNYARTCAGSGTAGFIDTTTNALLLPQAWRFQTNDSPFSFASIVVAKGSVTSDPGVSITADQLALGTQGSVSFGSGVHLRVPLISLDGASTLSFSGAADAVIDDLTVAGGSKVTTELGKALDLSLANLTVSSGSSVDVSAKGYTAMKGPGAPSGSSSGMGASYGGKGYANTATSTYGDARNPTDFGSGGYGAGGGVLSLTLSGTLTNNGSIAANGQWSGSGGSILVRAHEIIGGGMFSANGAGKDSSSFLGPAGGGRIALYTDTAISSFSGTVEAKGACNTNYGYYVYCGGDGTVVFEDTSPKVSNVLFLPGIKGSHLYRPEEGCDAGSPSCEDRLWEPGLDEGIFSSLLRGAGNDDVRDLFLDAQGKSSRSDVYVKEKDVSDSVGGKDFYASFIADMDALKSAGTIADWEPVAYDWRLSLPDIVEKGKKTGDRISYLEATSTPYIAQELRRLAASSKTGKVTIVAHSNGGLVTKALLNQLGGETATALVDKVIMVGVPQSGAPRAVGSLLYGAGEGLPFEHFDFLMSKAVAREFSERSPMAYHLLPSAQYFADANDPAHTVGAFAGTSGFSEERAAYGSTLNTADELYDYLLARDGGREKPAASDVSAANVLDESFISYARDTHAATDAWVPPTGITLYQIAGWGVDTVAGLRLTELPPAMAGPLAAAHRTMFSPTFVEDGDGVVPVPSALMTSTSSPNVMRYWMDLREYNKHHQNINHGNLFEMQELMDFINGIFNGTNSLPEFIKLTQPSSQTTDKKLVFILHSPLTLQLTDSAGNTSGLSRDDVVTQDIPGATYGEFGDAQYIIAPEGSYTLAMNGQAGGTFTLEMQEMSGNAVVSSATIANVPTTENTLASLTLSGGLDTASALAVDSDGDGEADISLAPRAGETVSYEPSAEPEPEPASEPEPAPFATRAPSGAARGADSPQPQVVAPAPAPAPVQIVPDIATTNPAVASSTPIETSTVAISTPAPEPVAAAPRVEKRVPEPSALVAEADSLPDLSQTASAYGASQQGALKKLVAAVYNGLYGLWEALKNLL